MDHAARIVERLAIDGQARVLGLAEHVHQLRDGRALVDRDDVGAGHHDVLDRELAEAQSAAEHAPLLRAQRVALAAGESVLDEFTEIGLFAKTEALEQALEPGDFLVWLTLLFVRQILLGRRNIAHGSASARRRSSASA